MLTSSDAIIEKDIHDFLNDREKELVQHGAYFLLEDDGFYCSKWRGLTGAEERVHSHEFKGLSFSIQGQIFPEFLFSVRKVDGKTCTWFQAERHGMRDIYQFFSHALCWFRYVVTEMNIGPRGSTHHTEANPIRIAEDRIRGSRHKSIEGLKKWSRIM
ncbi:MAG: hypothetical protein ACHQAX_02785 [Gammaproteobacteria bacterium]